MLRQRIVTALVLAAVVVGGVVFLPVGAFALFVLVLAIPGLYEWAALSGFHGAVSKVGYTLAGAVVLALLWVASAVWPIVLAVAALFWVLAAALVVSFPAGRPIAARRLWMAFAGAPVFAGAWLGLVALKQHESGHWFILWMFVLVWAADSGAYFAGRAFGRRRLAPQVSPGKTWEGAFGGTALAVVAASAMAWGLGWRPLSGWVVLAVGLAVVAIVGDLFESAVKRARDVKDSGGLLPGHGGVLDRIDSTVAVAPVLAVCLPVLV
ncbi:MAG: phosphatidate cytidylyltransferase [Gammaproteobacteria bacterium]|nr:phosphatidate cytidylyltransferase [Gammaproteobacteria bacterium]